MSIAVLEFADGRRPGTVGLKVGVRRSLLWSLVVPVSVVMALLVAALAWFTPRAVVDEAVEGATQRSLQNAQQLRALRAFYSQQVVAKAVHAGTRALADYKADPGAIPVPTAFLLDVAQAISTDDVKVSLVSPYPWPTRAGRVLDGFEQQAWDHLQADPAGRFVRRESLGGREVLRVAVGDRMDASCVSCHNTNPQSPKRDWNVGDVRGLIEVVTPIDSIARSAWFLSWRIVAAVVLVGSVLLALLLVMGVRLVRPLQDLAGAITRIARGQPQQSLPHVQRPDELGTVARALVYLQEQTSERARAEAQITHMALHDALTGLSNRVLFRDELDRALGRATILQPLAVLCLDLDRFKSVNDALGHSAGDALLVQVGLRLQACLDGETGIVARLGGDEFAILQIGGHQPVRATLLAERVIASLSDPYEVLGHQVVIGASVGIALGPGDGAGPDDLLKNADLALYRSKTDGRGVYRFFEREMDAKMQARRSLEIDLRGALPSNQFEVMYQPIVDLEGNRICGFEALLRWRHPARGLVSPADFIPLAEDIGIIAPIGAWVLKTACSEAARWPADIKVAINLSPMQFRNSGLVTDVTSALDRSGLAANRLELEITETVMLQDTEATLSLLHALRDLGVRISMDDFGTGYSSLGYLRKFPFDKIKIDQSFIRDMSDDDQSMAIIRAITGLGATLRMSTTAEGVETLEQFERVKAEGCTEVQGYLVSAPRPAADLPAIVRHGWQAGGLLQTG